MFFLPDMFFVPSFQYYIHRVGRTARAGRSGVAISLVNQYEVEWYMLIEKLIGIDFSYLHYCSLGHVIQE